MAQAQHPVFSPNWVILLTDWGYADLALDQRPGFNGREYLSGEWAAAVLYKGGKNPTNAIWFEPHWIYPDWDSGSDFGVETPFAATGMLNSTGFPIYHSVITNGDLRVEMLYEMMDTTNGIAQGITPRSSGGGGVSITSDRYVFRQTYKITNISGGTLTNLTFYQFLHGLNMTNSIIDNRVYSGPFSNYQYDNTQQGDSYSFHSETGEVWKHHDTMSMHAMKSPGEWEAGWYGMRPKDSHVFGKPSIGVHWDVEAGVLTDVDLFAPPPPTNHWVSGAQCFSMGTLAPGAMTNIDMLLSIRPDSVYFSAPVNVVIHNLRVTNNTVYIDFQDMTANPVIGFGLLQSTNANLPRSMWNPVGAPYYIDVPQAGWRQFRVPYNPMVPQSYYSIQAIPNN